MAEDDYREIFLLLRQEQHKYTYFLLAASGAAIALAVDQTRELSISISQLPLAVAVVFWGWSFFCGCMYQSYVIANIRANVSLLRVHGGFDPEIGADPRKINVASKGILEAVKSNSERANKLARSQFRYLILGAIFYLAWHIWEMYLRS